MGAASVGARRRRRRIAALAATAVASLVLAGCATAPIGEPSAHIALRLLGAKTFDHALQFGGTTVGGLSGIDYDPAHDLWVLVSDDRSRLAPTRFYTARLSIDEDGFHDATLESVVTLREPDGSPFAANAADAEAIRFDARIGGVWWSSEGRRRPEVAHDRAGEGDRAGLIDPFVRASSLDGRFLAEVPLAPMFRVQAGPRGPRDNLVFEGLSLSPDGRSLWVAMEGPLIQDGTMATTTHGAWSRLSRHDRASDGGFGPLAAQYAYRIDPIPVRGSWTTWLAETGVSEVLAVAATRLLVVERAFVLGPRWHIRLFEADVAGASDVKDVEALTAASTDGSFVPVAKRLVLDFDGLDVHVDNLEGVSFGPTLANGHRTLVFVSDDNFGTAQTTQLLAFEVLPR